MTLVSFVMSQFLTVNVLFFHNGPCYHSPLVAGTMTWGDTLAYGASRVLGSLCLGLAVTRQLMLSCSPASPRASPSQPANFPTTSGLQSHPANSSETLLWGENLPPPLLLSLGSFWTWGLFQSSLSFLLLLAGGQPQAGMLVNQLESSATGLYQLPERNRTSE